MPRLKHLTLALCMSMVFGTIAFAQSTNAPANARQIYTEARAEMDRLVMERRLGDAIRMFDGLGVPEDADLDALDARMRELYPDDFENVALVRSEVHKNGFRQEIIAYWTGRQYLYVYLLIHTDNNRPRLLYFQFDRDFHAVNALF